MNIHKVFKFYYVLESIYMQNYGTWLKCAVLVLKQGVKIRCEGIVLPDGQMMVEMDSNGYKYYLGVLEGADIMQKEMKEKIRREYLR